MKKFFAGLLAGILIATASTALAAEQYVQAVFAKFNFVVNGAKVDPGADPLVYQGTTYLPVRVFSNMLGYDVVYRADSRTIELWSAKQETEKEVEKMPETKTIISARVGEIVELDGVMVKVNGVSYEKRFKDMAAASKRLLAVLDLDIWFDSDGSADLRYPPTQSRSYVKEWTISTGTETTLGYPTSDSVTIEPGQWNNVTFALQIKEDERVNAVTLVSPFDRSQMVIVQLDQ